MNKSEKILSAFSQIFFYKDLVQESLCFTPTNKCERQLADLLINLGDTVIAIQLKARNESEQTTEQEIEMRWFNNKCKAAKKQIKDTLSYISSGEVLEFRNIRGLKVPVNKNSNIIPLIIFVNSEIKSYPHVLMKHSNDGLCVNCISFSDFQEMCKVLVTPIEIVSFLKYRQEFYEENLYVELFIHNNIENNTLLFKPMKKEALVFQFLEIKYGVNAIFKYESYLKEFQALLHSIPEHTVIKSEESAGFSIISFLAHFDRVEIKAFVERTNSAIIKSKEGMFGVVGTMRRPDIKYAVFFVAAKPDCMLQTNYLLNKTRKKQESRKLLQVNAFWENAEQYRIDFHLTINDE